MAEIYGLGNANGLSLAKRYMSGQLSEREVVDITGKSLSSLYNGLVNTMNYLNDHGNETVVENLKMKKTLRNFKHALPASVKV